MKKIFLMAISLFLLITISKAQTKKGNFLFDQSFSMGLDHASSIYKDNKTTGKAYKNLSIHVSPSVGYFVIDNLAIGLGVDYSLHYAKAKRPTIDGIKKCHNTYQEVGLSPYVKYYFGDKQLKPFIAGSFSFGKTFYENHYYKNEHGVIANEEVIISSTKEVIKDSNDYIGYTIEPGVSYFLNDKISIDLSLYYRYLKVYHYGASNITQSNDQIGVNFGFSILF